MDADTALGDGDLEHVAIEPHDRQFARHRERDPNPGGAQFGVMMKRKFGQNLFAFRGERQQDLAAVVPCARTMHKSSRFQPVHHFHRAMVADLHASSQFANPRAHARRHALDCQHELILAALQARFLHHLLAEM